MNHLVRIIRDEDGELQSSHTDWHLVDPANSESPRTLCGGEAFGEGESAVEYEEKAVQRGGITCRHCLNAIDTYKSVKL
jgi:hypothetical protein